MTERAYVLELEKLSPKELQVEFERVLNSIPTDMGDINRRKNNLAEVLSLARILSFSKGTKNLTSFVLKEAAKAYERGSEFQNSATLFDPEYQPSFPQTLFDKDGVGIFGGEAIRFESMTLEGYICSEDPHQRIVMGWKSEFEEHYGVTFEQATF